MFFFQTLFAEANTIEMLLEGKGLLPAIHFSLPEPGSYVDNKQAITLIQESELENIIEINPIGIGVKVRVKKLLFCRQFKKN